MTLIFLSLEAMKALKKEMKVHAMFLVSRGEIQAKTLPDM